MRQIALWSLFLLVNATSYANEIKFEQGLTWEQVRKKAHDENKYIFVDCYTTWCGPCKEMDQKVYNNPEIIDHLNRDFISIKVQLDSTTNDLEDVKKWYAEARSLMYKYKIAVYPTYLFFSPEGKLVHRGKGFIEATKFDALLTKACDSNQQIYSLLDKFYEQKLEYSGMPSLIEELGKVNEGKAVKDIVEYYLNKYLLKLPADSIYTERNLRFIGKYIFDSRGTAFNWYYQHRNRIDSVMKKDWCNSFLDRIIYKEEIAPSVKKWDSLGIVSISNESWFNLSKAIEKRYNVDFANRNVLETQIKWYTGKKRWDEAAFFYSKKMEIYGVNTSDDLHAAVTNNVVYFNIFPYITDNTVLDKALGWMKIICEAFPNERSYMDTYANLLYKRGEKEKAMKLEKKAASVSSKDNSPYLECLEKMKKGLPTWASN